MARVDPRQVPIDPRPRRGRRPRGQTSRRELRNLEQRGEKVDHPAGLSDDRANSLMLAICMAVQSAIKPASFAVVESYTKNWTQPVSGRGVDRQGTRYLGDGNFMTSSGERYRDPRYS